MKHNFTNDYSEGAHPKILERLMHTNMQQQIGYGQDNYSIEAKNLIKKLINNPHAEVYFVAGGTQANLLVISSMLKIHEAVISTSTGHIYTHETGAIEAVGHRIIPIDSKDGKLTPKDVEEVLHNHSLRPHVVKPKMVYVSNSTEIGTIYSKSELKELSIFCKKHNLIFYMDGARLGNALKSENNDLTLAEIASLTDIFYIGGTKNGAMLGEAIIFKNSNLHPEFDYVMKQKGALLAKGRVLGIQFLELFKDDLYFKLAEHSNKMAMKIANAIQELGYTLLTPFYTNQIFPILPTALINELKHNYSFYEWSAIDSSHSVVRLITSWATSENIVDEFINDFSLLHYAHLENKNLKKAESKF